MQQINKTLSNFGLTNKEIKVYLEILKLDSTSPYELSKLTGIPRTSIYDTLMTLSLKKLVKLQQSDGFQKKQTKVKAVNPSKLREILRTKRKKMFSLEADVLNIIPFLKKDFHKNKTNADFQYYPGVEGAKHVLFSEMKPNINIDAFENLMPMDAFGRKTMNKGVEKDTKAIKQHRIQLRELVVDNDWTRHVLTYQVGKDNEYIKSRKIRIIDNPILNIKLRAAIQGERVRIVCSDKDEIWGLIIKSNPLSSTLQSMFNFMWQQAKPVTLNMIESWGKNEFLETEKK